MEQHQQVSPSNGRDERLQRLAARFRRLLDKRRRVRRQRTLWHCLVCDGWYAPEITVCPCGERKME